MADTEEDTYDALTQSLSGALKESSSTISDSIKDIASSVGQGTHGLMHAIAISDEGRASDEQSELPIYKKVPEAPAPYGYIPQAPTASLPTMSTEPVLTQLKRLKS